MYRYISHHIYRHLSVLGYVWGFSVSYKVPLNISLFKNKIMNPQGVDGKCKSLLERAEAAKLVSL